KGEGEGSSPVGEAVEKEGDGSSKGSMLAGLDTIKMNNLRIRTIRKELAAVRKELQDLRKLRNFGYVDKQGVEGEGKEDCVPEDPMKIVHLQKFQVKLLIKFLVKQTKQLVMKLQVKQVRQLQLK
ncbi:hypothetical protein V8G54_008956, partial [Vigna mungo]